MKATGIMERHSTIDRLAALRESKQQQTLEKQQVRGAMDFDDHAVILPPQEIRETVKTLGGSGVYFTDVIMSTFTPAPKSSERRLLRAAGPMAKISAGSSKFIPSTSIPCLHSPEGTW